MRSTQAGPQIVISKSGRRWPEAGQETPTCPSSCFPSGSSSSSSSRKATSSSRSSPISSPRLHSWPSSWTSTRRRLSSSSQINSRVSLAPSGSAPGDMRIWSALPDGGTSLRALGGGPSPGGTSPASLSCFHSSIVSEQWLPAAGSSKVQNDPGPWGPGGWGE